MCKAKHYAEELLTVYEKVKNDINGLYVSLKETELKEQDYLHIIENEKFNASQGYLLSKLIKDNRTKRRDIKNEIHTLVNLKKSFVDKNIGNLKSLYGDIKRNDDMLNSLKERKVYIPRILATTELKSVINT